MILLIVPVGNKLNLEYTSHGNIQINMFYNDMSQNNCQSFIVVTLYIQTIVCAQDNIGITWKTITIILIQLQFYKNTNSIIQSKNHYKIKQFKKESLRT